MKLETELRDFTRSALEKFVKQLLSASEAEEKELLKKLNSKNDLADLDEEMHGKPNTPEVEEDDLERTDLADVPKQKKRGK